VRDIRFREVCAALWWRSGECGRRAHAVLLVLVRGSQECQSCWMIGTEDVDRSFRSWRRQVTVGVFKIGVSVVSGCRFEGRFDFFLYR
jgi:hypothetical protein